MSELAVFLRHSKRSNAKHLSLENRGLQYIPKEVFSIKSVEILNLSDNKITSIEPAIANLFRLRELHLRNNSLTQLPKQITELPLLSVLSLKGNPLHQKFNSLIEIPNSHALIDILHHCFQNHQQSPSWLTDSKEDQTSPQFELAWKEQQLPTMAKTASGFRRNKIESKSEVEPENQSKNGILEVSLKYLKIGEQISMGGFSTIHKGNYGQLAVAVKKVFNPNISQELMSQFQNEIAMLGKYRHPNVVLLIGAVSRPPTLCMVMELVREGSLYELIHKRKVQLSEEEKGRIVRQLVDVYCYLHQHGIVHRDIKSQNVLIDQQYHVKICDFGLAKHKSQLNMGPMQFSGTPSYMAPELFLKRSYSEAVDVFALVTLLYEIYYGEIPYQGMEPLDIKEKVIKNTKLSPKLTVPAAITTLINQGRALDPDQRPTMHHLSQFSQW